MFIFSGLIKLNDPMGFGFKLEEYFSEGVLNLPFLSPIAMEMAIVICVFEILVGLALLLGLWRKLTAWMLLLMILFFTFLTFYSAYFNKVTDCGCFGDAIPLTPWQSFGKDVILSVLILIIFAGKEYIKPLVNNTVGIAALAIVTLGCGAVVNHVLNHLPIKDFRAYKVGTDIVHGMKPAEEVGEEPPVYETFFVMENAAGERIEITGTEYVDDKWYEKSEWTLLNDLSESRMIKEGYEPPIHDFSLESDTGDITDWILHERIMILVLNYELEKASDEGLKAISSWAWRLDEAGFPITGWTSSGYDVIDQVQTDYQMPFAYTIGDGTAIKTVVRSNPGIVALRSGVIMGKWHWNDRPSVEELKALYQ